jgi:hypothetical protein
VRFLPSAFRLLPSNLDDGAGGFVAEDARRGDGAVLDFFDVGGADAADRDLHQQFVGADGRDGDGFEAEVIDAAINDGAHGLWDVGHAVYFNAKTQRFSRRKEQAILHAFAPLLFNPRFQHFSISVFSFSVVIPCSSVVDKFREPGLGGALNFKRPAAPEKPQRPGVQGVIFKNQPRALQIGQAAFDKGQITILLAAVNLVADDRMAEMRQVNAELVLASGAGDEAEKAEG